MSVPEKIGRYEILDELGRGGMAVVYLARDPYMARQVAVKLLPRQFAPSDSLQARFQREARIVASLEHPAIVPVHDFGEYNEQPFLVMRYMVGGSLKGHAGGEPLALTEVVRILSPLANALDKAHSQHIIHRDLKPDNILFDGDKNPYLSDFGIARLAQGTQTTSIMGTPAYMSPEQIKGDVQLDGRSDIYALGVILFEMLSGQQPYTADTPTQVMMKHVLEPVPIILDLAAELPPTTQLIIEKAMAKERDDRYKTAEALVLAVKELLTASQSAEVGAALAAAEMQKTIVEYPELTPISPETIVEEPSFMPSSVDVDREAQLAAQYARMQTAVAASDWVEVLAIGAQIQTLDRHYRDVQAIMVRAQSQLTQPVPPLQPEVIVPVEGEALAHAQAHPALATEKAPTSRGRQILVLGCAVIILIVLCLVLLVVAGTYFNDEMTAGDSPTTDVMTSSADVVAATDDTIVVPSSTPQQAAEVTPTAEPTIEQPDPTAEPAQPPPAGEPFSDAFDSKSSADNWELWQDESAEFRIGDGQLTAVGMDEETLSWVRLVNAYDAFEATVDADIVEGGSSAFFGFVFDGDGDNYVGCFVQGDNSAYCAESLNGETEYGDWAIVDLSVLRDNEILFVVYGDQWAMAVNDQCIGSGTVDFPSGGQPALAVTTESNEVRAVVTYDNLVVRSPTDQGLDLLNCQADYFESG